MTSSTGTVSYISNSDGLLTLFLQLLLSKAATDMKESGEMEPDMVEELIIAGKYLFHG